MSSKYSQSTGCSIDPIALKDAPIWVNQLAIATFHVFVIKNLIIVVLCADMFFPAHIIFSFTARRIDRHHAHLARVLKLALFHSLEGQLGVLQTKQLIISHCLVFFGQRLQC